MSRSRNYFDSRDGINEPGGSCGNALLGCGDDEFAQLTKVKSAPHERLSKVLPGKAKLPVSPVKMLMGRECNYSGRGRFSLSDSCHVLSRFLPVYGPTVIDKMKSCAYVSQFSDDGSLFVAGFQVYASISPVVHIVDVGSATKESHANVTTTARAEYRPRAAWCLKGGTQIQNSLVLVKSAKHGGRGPNVGVLDRNGRSSCEQYSPATVTKLRKLTVRKGAQLQVVAVRKVAGAWDKDRKKKKKKTFPAREIHEGLEFSSNVDDYEDYSFGIFSVKFSTDGRELVAASSDESIYVYDLEARRQSLRIPAHMSDVNAVCFADESGHIIYSGSDDHLCKVWDRRCFVSRGQAAGVLMGHLEGITFVDTRGDGRYLISNGKDQAIKLWDIRKMSSNVNYTPRRRYAEWDYRWMEYPEQARNLRHPDDLSLATYKGHTVLRTLIRCYFSPAYSTGQKYIYTGSTDSSVYVYDVVSGGQVAKLDYHEDPVRDCNWHPFYPMIVSSSWDGMIARWEFPGSGENTLPVKRTRRRRRFFY
ncbi:hypothetical protein DH2020_035836 [Rehmannia glutinosa]|uniref:LEC14B homolog n=1 Tax=Rehmannia glutinosa TaxID=99300 RepID=A0ABR0V7X0_REHGL